jgi:hypothetical protein
MAKEVRVEISFYTGQQFTEELPFIAKSSFVESGGRRTMMPHSRIGKMTGL